MHMHFFRAMLLWCPRKPWGDFFERSWHHFEKWVGDHFQIHLPIPSRSWSFIKKLELGTAMIDRSIISENC